MLERIVDKSLKEEWGFIVQRGNNGFSIVQTQYEKNGQEWVRAYIITSDSSPETVKIANSIFNYLEEGWVSKTNRHYVLVTPHYMKHKTLFIDDGDDYTSIETPEKSDLEGVYLPPK